MQRLAIVVALPDPHLGVAQLINGVVRACKVFGLLIEYHGRNVPGLPCGKLAPAHGRSLRCRNYLIGVQVMFSMPALEHGICLKSRMLHFDVSMQEDLA